MEYEDSLFLNSGITRASFQDVGNLHYVKDLLNSMDTGLETVEATPLSILWPIKSLPQALFTGNIFRNIFDFHFMYSNKIKVFD